MIEVEISKTQSLDTTERFEYYLDRFIQADTPEDKQKVIEEYTEVCFSGMEKTMNNHVNGRTV